jgi:hypothetical protein
VRDQQPSLFKQSTIFLLKKLQTDLPLKNAVIALLTDNSIEGKDKAESGLICTFGDQDYSILNALSSERRQTRQSALQALSDKEFFSKLLQSEREIIQIILL